MPTYSIKPIAILAALLIAIATAAAAEPATDGEWGEAVDGLACRLSAKKDFCIGEPVSLAIELKNVSDQERTLIDLSSVYDCTLAGLTVTGPNGAKVRQNFKGGYGENLAYSCFKPLKAGEVKRIEFRGIEHWFDWGPNHPNGLSSPGEYSVSYMFAGIDRNKVVSKQTFTDGKFHYDYVAPTEENVAKCFWKRVESNTIKFKIVPVSKDDLTVHEWGVFSVYNDLAFANADSKVEWDALPQFVYRQFPLKAIQTEVPRGFARKPILYFYSQREHLSVNVKLTFTEGVPAVWWPNCNKSWNTKADPADQTRVANALEWTALLGTKMSPYISNATPEDLKKDVPLTELPEGSWFKIARDIPNAVAITGSNGASKFAGYVTSESERFLYYDGILSAPRFIGFSVTKDEVKAKNSGTSAIKHLFVVDRRNTGKNAPIRFAHLKDGIAPGSETPVTFQDVATADWPAIGATEVEMALLEAGLFKAEAQSIVKIWREGFFERPGVTAFYLFPQAEYDKMIALQVTPTPGEVLRVGIALHHGIDGDPELTEKARTLIGRLNAEDFNQREAAIKGLTELGPVAIRELRAALEKATDPETTSHCREILKKIDASSFPDEKRPPPVKNRTTDHD